MSKEIVESAVQPGQSPDFDLDNALKSLSRKTRWLHLTSPTIALLTLVNLVSPLAIWFSRILLHIDSYRYVVFMDALLETILLLDFFVLVAVVCSLVLHDRLNADGESIFQEISDELEWHVKQSRNGNAQKPVSSKKQTPGLATRLVLREFVQAGRLPFFRNQWGGPFFLVLNVVITMFSFTLSFYTFTKQ